ncbi:MAG TPA: alpha/beta hydrolase [Vicinamibacterales bacterium]|nr:alpha/beta hydrolase [Vicinamibacterales bacterium]
MRPDQPTDAFLKMLAAAGRPPLDEQGVHAARAGTRASSLQIAGPLAPVHRVEDRTIPTPAGGVGIRTYWPRPSAAPLPLVLQFHGGGFVLCDLDTHDALARHYCRHADAIVVSVDYRLAPEHKFPAAVDDSYAALCWVAEHAGELGGDPTRIAVTGDSAGGNLAAVVCQLARDRRGPAVAFQALVYPNVELGAAEAEFPSRREFGGGEYFLSTRDMAWFTSLYLNDAATEVRDPRASPLRAADLRGLPPALVLTAGCDPLRDEGRAYADRLAAAGVPVEYRCYEGAIHVFLSFASVIPAGDEARSFVAGRLRAALHPAQVGQA